MNYRGIIKKKFILIILILLVLISGCKKNNENENNNFISTTEEIADNVDLDNGDEKIDCGALETSNLELTNESVTITKEGTYTLTGTISNGSVIVDTTGDIKLILDNVDITNDSNPAIIIESANNTVIELKENSINNLSDGSKYSNKEYDG